MATPIVDNKNDIGLNGNAPMIDLHDVNKYYKTAAGDFHALENV